MNVKKILIVGGTGFIGRHLAKKCLKKNWHVTSVSLNKSLKLKKLKKVKYLFLDTSKYKNLKKKIQTNFDYVVNLSGYINHKDKDLAHKAHVVAVKNLATFFLEKKLKLFVQAGSSSEYGLAKSPHKEEDKCNPKTIYGKSKLKATNFLINIFNKKNFPVTILRFYQVYGPGQSIDRFVPLLINSCLKNIEFPTSHGKQKRDFLYVDDCVNAILKTLSNNNCKGKIINIGSGKAVSLRKIIWHVKKNIKKGKILFGKTSLRIDEPNKIFPDLTKARKILNWASQKSFITGINKTINFYRREII